MKVEAYVFLVIGFFFALVDIVYWYMSKDWTGTACLFLAMGLGLLIGGYLAFTATRIPPRPEDRGTAEVAEGAGSVGHFSPGSAWPIMVAASAMIMVIGLVIGVWLVALGIAGLLVTVSGLLLEHFNGAGVTDS